MNRDRRRALRLLWDASPRLWLLLAVDTIANGVLPVAALIALAPLVAELPGAVQIKMSSASGQVLTQDFVRLAIVLAAAALAPLLHQVLSATVRVQMTYSMQARLMAEVSRPAGILHLEQTEVLDHLAMAHGGLMSWSPADAPAALAAVWSKRLSCVLASLAVGWYAWPAGVGLLVVWPATRRPILRVIREHVAALGGNAEVMRRAEYLRELVSTREATKEIRLFGLSDWLIGTFRTTWSDGMAEVWAIRNGIYRTIWWVWVALVLTYVSAGLYVAWMAADDALQLHAVAVVLPALGFTMIVGGISFDDIALEWMLSAVPHLDSLERELRHDDEPSKGGVPVFAAGPPEVRFEAVRFSYAGASAPVLDGLDLTLHAGRSTAIVGANGAGKTTLVKLLCGLYEPDGGRITCDNVDLATVDPRSWQRQIAVVFQDFLRLPLGADANVGFGALEHVRDHDGLAAAAARAGIRDRLESLPDGWATVLSSAYAGGSDLSGGEWQRVALARALFASAHGASLLVLDEPTAWMDARGEAMFFEQFLDVTRGLTTVVISHRFSTVRLADRICVLADGRVVEEGTHEELLLMGGRYHRLFSLQAARFADRDEPHPEVDA